MPKTQLDLISALEMRRDAVVELWEHLRDHTRNDFEKIALDELFMPQIAAVEHALEKMRDIMN